ncbi:MAG TPA: peptidoglycan DD-metalloendopeptidase family protein [Candidatus Deferrimicrobiaceae bacterium]
MRGAASLPAALLLFALLAQILAPASAVGRDAAGDLRKEKARLLEMKAREEKAAAELTEALRKEKLTKERVEELKGRLAAQKRTIARIDRKVASLTERLEKTEREAKALEDARTRAESDLRSASAVAFAGLLARGGMPPDPPGEERNRYFMRVYLGADLEDVRRLARERERKEEELSGIERQVELTERRMAKEKKVGETLLSRQAEERKRLSEVEREKRKKEKELKALRARIARLESIVSRVERQVREREMRSRKGVGPPRGEPVKPGMEEALRRFSTLPGGVVPPLGGKVVTRFGKQHDPTFDVTIENRGVEIEAPSAAPVKSVGKGEVAFAGNVSGYGNVLIVQHGGGLFSVYGKLDSFSVRQGEAVGKGQTLGRLPESPAGKSVLYLELRAGGTAVDPASAIPLIR